jgi:hypothetical protein
MGTIVVSATIFFGIALLLGVDELRDVFDLVRRRIGRGGSPKPPAGD